MDKKISGSFRRNLFKIKILLKYALNLIITFYFLEFPFTLNHLKKHTLIT